MLAGKTLQLERGAGHFHRTAPDQNSPTENSTRNDRFVQGELARRTNSQEASMIYRSHAMTGLGLQTSLECSCVYTPGTSSYA